jgi:hypothetical protein
MTRWFLDDLGVTEYEARHAWRNAFLGFLLIAGVIATAFVTGSVS